MKRKASLLLTLLVSIALFYNVIGYYLMDAFKTEQTWISAMQNIPDSEFKVIKLNASLYSFTEDTEMEYVNENVTINNVSYHIFKKRIQNNIINLYYLQNYNQNDVYKKLEKMADDHLCNNSSTNKTPIKKIFKSGLTDFIFESKSFKNEVICTELKTELAVNDSQSSIHPGYLFLFKIPPRNSTI